MFKNPFSLKGRIARTEYALSLISSFVFLLITSSVASDYLHGDFILTITLLCFIWFNLAQGSKRCHDVDQSGIMQIIPFYGFVLIFQEGSYGNNSYGTNPKSDEYKQEKVLIHFKNEEPILQLVQESLPYILFNSILIALTFRFLNINDFIFNISLYLTIVISYLLFILISKNKYNSIESRFIYILLVFIFVRFYSILFLNYSFDFLFLIIELSFIVVGIILTYLSSTLYKSLKKNKHFE
jgi:uncharacterized membrane protein YhaH (DUF805 family)